MADGNPLVDATDWRIVQLLADGRSSREVAAEMFASRSLIDRHLLRLRQQLGAKTNAQLVAMALRRGWIT